MILGAGRGPLVTAALDALKQLAVSARVFAVEKNPSAIVTYVALSSF